MNPIYSILESPHRWLLLSGISFLAGVIGGIVMLALVWPHAIARIWLIAALVIAAYFLMRQGQDLLAGADASRTARGSQGGASPTQSSLPKDQQPAG
jgi:hypothetical protein